MEANAVDFMVTRLKVIVPLRRLTFWESLVARKYFMSHKSDFSNL